MLAGRLPARDRAVLVKPQNYAKLTGSLREVFRQSGAAAAHDLVLYVSPWNFELGRVRSPCHLWHGESDTVVPVAVGRRLAVTLPRCEARFLPDEGHVSLPILHMETILQTLWTHGGM